jgi:tetratricopeptide (TPR) repeat protein
MTPEAEGLVKKVRREAKGLQMPKIEARALETLGSIREKQSDLDGAIEFYEQALGLLTAEPPTSWAYPMGGMARCFAMKGEGHYGIHLAETLRTRLRDEGLEDPAAMAWLLGPLVFCYFNVGMRREASELAQKAQSLVAAIPDDPAAAALLVNVAQVHQEREEYPEAKAALSRAEEIFRRLNFRAELGITHLSRGYVHSRSGELPEAKAALTTAIEMLETTGSQGNEANAIAELGRVERLTGDFKRAAELLKTSVDLLEGADDKRVLAWSKRELGLVYVDSSPRKAEALFKEAISIYETTSEVVELAHTYRHYGDFLISQGRDTKGHEAHRRGLLALERGL